MDIHFMATMIWTSTETMVNLSLEKSWDCKDHKTSTTLWVLYDFPFVEKVNQYDLNVSDPYFLAYNVKPERAKKVATLVGYKWFRFDIFLNITIETDEERKLGFDYSIFHITTGDNSGSAGTRVPALWYSYRDKKELCVYFDNSYNVQNERICSGHFEENQHTMVKIRYFQELSFISAGYLNFEFCVNEHCQRYRWYHPSLSSYYWYTWSEVSLYLSNPWFSPAKSIIHSFGVNIGKL